MTLINRLIPRKFPVYVTDSIRSSDDGIWIRWSWLGGYWLWRRPKSFAELKNFRVQHWLDYSQGRTGINFRGK